jgi:hypothetical protein
VSWPPRCGSQAATPSSAGLRGLSSVSLAFPYCSASGTMPCSVPQQVARVCHSAQGVSWGVPFLTMPHPLTLLKTQRKSAKGVPGVSFCSLTLLSACAQGGSFADFAQWHTPGAEGSDFSRVCWGVSCTLQSRTPHPDAPAMRHDAGQSPSRMPPVFSGLLGASINRAVFGVCGQPRSARRKIRRQYRSGSLNGSASA